MEQEGRVHGLADGIVPPERKRDIGETSTSLGTGQGLLDLPHGLDEVDGVVVVLLDAGGDRQDVRVEDDVLGIKADLVHQKPVRAGADADLVLLGGGLPLLVEGHDDHCGAVALGETGTLQEGLLSILEADRVQHALALEALHPLLQHRPLGAVDHDRHATDLGIGREEIQEGLHDRLTVEHPLVDVHVEDIGPALNLLARHREGGLVIARDDELREARRSGDIRPLADHHEGTPLPDREGLQTTQAGGGLGCRGKTRGMGTDRLGDRGDVLWR